MKILMNKNLHKCMVAIHIFFTMKLGGANIKKNKSSKSYLASEDKKASKQRNKHKITEADERSLWAIYNSLASCISFSLYPYNYPIFPQVTFDNKLENNTIDKHLKEQDE